MKKVLVVDDEPSVRVMLSQLLSGRGACVVTSDSFEEASEIISKVNFDLIIADIRLSGVFGIEGLELLSNIRKTSPATEVIVMTDYGTDEIREESYRRGAYHYCEKPLDLTDLFSRINELDIPVPSVLDSGL